VTTPAPTTDLSDHVEWMKREVAVPGTFASLFPTTTDDDLSAALVDGFYRAKLDGWFPRIEADPDTFEVTPAISLTAVALVVVYSSIKFVQNEIKNMDSRFLAESAGNRFEREKAPTILTERLKELTAERNDLLAQARRPSARPVYMHDGYAIRIGTLYPVERMNYVQYQAISPTGLT